MALAGWIADFGRLLARILSADFTNLSKSIFEDKYRLLLRVLRYVNKE